MRILKLDVRPIQMILIEERAMIRQGMNSLLRTKHEVNTGQRSVLTASQPF